MKFAALIGFATCACVAHGSYLPSNPLFESAKDYLEAAKQKVSEQISQATDLVQNTANEYKQKAENLTDQLQESAEKIKVSASESINEIANGLNKEVDEIEQLAKKNDVQNITECTDIRKKLTEPAKVIANTIKCFTDKVETGKDLVKKIATLSYTVSMDLIKLKKESEECDQGNTGFLAEAATKACLMRNSAKVTWVVTSKVPSLAMDLKAVVDLIRTLKPSLTECVQSNIQTFKAETKLIVDTIKQCVSDKINRVKA